MSNKIKNILFDFGWVILPEGDVNINKQLKKIFFCDDSDIDLMTIFNKYRNKLRNWKIWEQELVIFFLDHLDKKSYDKSMLDELWIKMLNELKWYNLELVKFVQKLRKTWYKCWILSDTYTPIKSYILDAWLYIWFDEIFLSCDIGHSKKDCLSWDNSIFKYLEARGITNNNSLIIDDRKENCEFAKTQWFKTIQHIDTIKTKNTLKKLLFI